MKINLHLHIASWCVFVGKPALKSHSLYISGDYVAWNQPRREMIRPDNIYHPSQDKFDHRTTVQDAYIYKGPVVTKSCKPFKPPPMKKVPLEDVTNYKMSYVAHPPVKRHVHEPEPYKPSHVPFDGLTTHNLSYKGLAGEPAKSMKPPHKMSESESLFIDTTEFREKYQAWPVSSVFTRKPDVYVPPKDKMDLTTTAQIHYGNPNGRPATSCKPLGRILQSTGPFDHSSTMKADYKAWQYSKPKAICPTSEIKVSAAPMDTLTTFQTHYVPHPLPFTKSFRPRLPAPRPHVPFAQDTTYATSYTPKQVNICPASFKEPPGYIFEKIDEGGHRRFRPRLLAQSRCSSNSKITNHRDSFPGSGLNQTGLNKPAMIS